MRIGVSPYGSTREEVLKLARRAGEAGLDGLMMGDGLISTPSFPAWSGGVDSFVELAWLAGQVDVRTYGINALVLPARDPRIVAKQAYSLNAVTGGRCVLGVCAGFWEHDAQLFGFDFAERGARFDEGVRALQALWRGDLEFRGRFWSWSAAGPIGPCGEVDPPELWLAGGEATMRRAIRYGLPWQPTRATPEELSPLAHAYADAGGTRLAVRARMSVTEQVGSHGPLRFPALVGPPSYLADRLHAYAELGATYVSVVAGFDYPSCVATIDALGEAAPVLA
jgi:alkanesulfonate monooxygenase SsuD/methylene tetrahydromethanopterin reductase-like flavin-dependent oxidoreductase (luciferase family)